MKLIIKIFFSLIIGSNTTINLASEKVLIITHSHSRPDFIEIQDKTFKAFLQDDYEFIVFNDAPNDHLCRSIEHTCNNLNIECIRVPQGMHQSNTPADRHSDGIQLSLNKRGYNHKGIVLILDSDMFLIKPLNIAQYLQDYDIVGLHQERSKNNVTVKYIWPGLLFMNMNKLPNKRTINLSCGKVHGVSVDTGGQIHHYLTNNPSLKINLYSATSTTWLANNSEQLRENGFDEITTEFILNLKKNSEYGMEFHLNSHFIHYYAGGSNWANYSDAILQSKTAILNHFVNQIIEQVDKKRQILNG